MLERGAGLNTSHAHQASTGTRIIENHKISNHKSARFTLKSLSGFCSEEKNKHFLTIYAPFFSVMLNLSCFFSISFLCFYNYAHIMKCEQFITIYSAIFSPFCFFFLNAKFWFCLCYAHIMKHKFLTSYSPICFRF